MRLLVTGGAGFIGSNFVRMFQHAYDITVLDKLTYAANRSNLDDVNARFILGDIADPIVVGSLMPEVDAVVNFAAESHVDRSIQSDEHFIRTNVEGTRVLLRAAKQAGTKRFLHVSTDEVYGAITEGSADEEAPLQPRNPYSASKAAADHLVNAYHITHGIPTLITRSSNNYGPHQFPEKVIPRWIAKIVQKQPIEIQGTGAAVRDFLHVEDNCRAIQAVLEHGEIGETYNIAAENYLSIKQLAELFEGVFETVVNFIADRPGQDLRYSIEATKVRSLGWSPKIVLQNGLVDTVEWYLNHQSWWQKAIREAERFYATLA